MSSMSYCRFENLYKDLREAKDFFEESVSEDEERYRQRCISLMKDILESGGWIAEEDKD